MDTRFWGPPGWRLLHHATFVYTPDQKQAYAAFFEALPYILPCKFCRAGLTDTYEVLPIDLSSREALIHWLYKVHNKVNKKLRDNHLHAGDDPTFSDVKHRYTSWIGQAQPLQRLTTFWDFLFAVGYNHPKEASRGSTPLQHCPPGALTCDDPCVRNRWNTLPAADRMKWYRQFWDNVVPVLGYELGTLWSATKEADSKDVLDCRRSTVAWLWRQRCALDPEYHDPYSDVCRYVSSFSSDCAIKKRAKTCRRPRVRK